MTIKFLIASLGALVVALAASILFLVSSPETESISSGASLHKPASVSAKNASISSGENESPRLPPLDFTTAPPIVSEPPPKMDGSSRQAILDRIQDAIGTYSNEGVAVVEPLLGSPDLEIRETAVEAMKQIGTPGAAESLRWAANKSTVSPIEKKILLDAAAFIDLPPYQFNKKQ